MGIDSFFKPKVKNESDLVSPPAKPVKREPLNPPKVEQMTVSSDEEDESW